MITAKVLLGHFMFKIDSSKAKVALDPVRIKGLPTLRGGSLGSACRIKYGADPVW